MANGTRSGGRAPRSIQGCQEWIGGIVRFPWTVTGEGAPFRPEGLLWLRSDRLVLGATMGRAEELLAQARESLQGAMDEPMIGPPHRPERVRVASPDLAETLRGGYPDIEFVCAPTPEIDEVFASMKERMMEDAAPEEASYLSLQEPESIRAFLAAAAELFRAAPWKVIPSDDRLFTVSVEALGVHDSVLSVVGQLGQSRGLVLFPGVEEFEDYLDAAKRMKAGEKEPELPAHKALAFERGADMPPELRREIIQHGWEVADTDAYPRVMILDEDMVPRLAAREDLLLFEALARALPEAVADAEAVAEAWEGGEPVTRAVSVATQGGPMEVKLRTPPPEYEAIDLSPPDALAALAALVEGGEGLGSAQRHPLEVALLRRFERSPEAAGQADTWACEVVMDMAANYLGHTIATLRPAGLREILFDLVPRKVSIPPSQAAEFVGGLRAFYKFLKREGGLKGTDGCLRVLSRKAVEELEVELSDSDNFDMAKALFMAGREAGFDMETEEGIQAWLRAAEGGAAPGLRDGAPGDPPSRRGGKAADAAKKKKKRKAARKARKKNR